MKKTVALIVVVLVSSIFTKNFAGEGMWLPLLLEKLNYEEMKEMGLELTPE